MVHKGAPEELGNYGNKYTKWISNYLIYKARLEGSWEAP